MKANYSICIPKLSNTITESTICSLITNTNFCTILNYKEIPWKNSTLFKRVLMYIKWNQEHEQYTVLQEQLNHGKSIKIIDFPNDYYIFKYKKGGKGT